MASGPYYPDGKVVAFMQGELVATARRMLHAYRIKSTLSASEVKNSAPGIVNFDEAHHEMERLIGNAFQMRSDCGDMVQLSKLILFMHSEQTEIY
jgi:hypothetical protein